MSIQPPIKDYAIIGDCRTAALVSCDGSIDWLCLPDFSSPSIFARLIDEKGGCFAVRPRADFTVKRRYVDDTAILETTFETGEGVIRLLDLFPMIESVTTLAPLRELLRVVECVTGEVELEIVFDPQPDYGRTRSPLKFDDGVGWRLCWSNELLVLNTTAQCWLRDAGLTMSALIGLGFYVEAEAYLDWLLHATRPTWPRLNILYDVYGRPQLSERQLAHLSGYRRSRPVRVGNAAIDQLQLDVYGQVVMAAEVFATGGGKLDTTEARMLRGFGDVVCATWREPDNGIWETPDPRRHHTLSKVLCWVALDRLLSLEEKGMIRLGRRGELFRRERDAIARCIEERGFNPAISSYVSELDGNETDAGLLLMACVGYRGAQHARMVSTFDRIHGELASGGLLYRYRPGRDGLAGEEGAFGLCGFSAVDHLAARGQIEQAERYFDHLLSFANDLGLFSEEIDPKTGAALGNFPQAFTHVGVIYAAISLAKARREHGA